MVGNTIGAASASLVGSAYGLAKGVTTGILETVQIVDKKGSLKIDNAASGASPTARPLKDKNMDAILDGEIKMTAKEARSVGHCLACHTWNRGHHPHLRYGDCERLPAVPVLTNQSHDIPIPDDDFDLAEESSFHSISNSVIPEKSKDVLKDDEVPEQVQTTEKMIQTDGPNPDVLLQRLAKVESMLADVRLSQSNTDDETKVNSKRLGILEAEVEHVLRERR